MTHVRSTPTILSVIGITGDLAGKKIIPSLWHLFQKRLLSDKFLIIGFSRRKLSDEEFRNFVRESIQKKTSESIHAGEFSLFFEAFQYHEGTFENEKTFQVLAEKITEKEISWGVCANTLFYLAVPPSHYAPILKNMAAAKLNLPCGGGLGWSRILIEKPFGTDLSSAQGLQALLSSYFKEEQIYRIDHYLFKEIVQGIENFRFSNNLFERSWDNSSIERIELKLHETIGVEDRGSFYDAVGALRDVGQNHLLSMLTAITSTFPASGSAEAIQKKRADVLASLLPWSTDGLQRNTYRAQYNGYTDITGVRKNSDIETYFALQTELLHPKWKGVPIVIDAGKQLQEVRKEIILTLKHPPFCHLCEIGKHGPNRIIFRIEPTQEILINFWTKKPGFERSLEERSFTFFLYEKQNKAQYVEEYAKVLYCAINGERSLFVSETEVETMWKFIDPIVNAWKEGLVSLKKYEFGTTPKVEFLKDTLDKVHHQNQKDTNKEIGIIGLGKMGANLSLHLLEKGWRVYGFNRSPEVTKKLEAEGIVGVYSLSELVGELSAPRIIWLMIPHQAVELLLDELLPFVSKGDAIIDGGNSPYKQSVTLSKKLEEKGINFMDVGVSGGPEGARYGACLMVGGKKDLFDTYEPLFQDLSAQEGYVYVGSSGAGHFVKMVHNGIEYGMMQAIGEGFAILKKSPFSLNVRAIANLYNHGSVIASRLVGWLADAYIKFGSNLDSDECCSGKVSHSGEGRWTVETAKEMDMPVEIIERAVEFRKKSKEKPSYTGQVVSAMRHEFGGHDSKTKEE